MTARLALALSLLSGYVCPASAQSPSPSSSDQAIPSRVNYFVGRWQYQQEIAGDTYVKTETCERFAGADHVICEAQGTSPLGAYRSHTVVSYDVAKKTFTRYTVTTHGKASYARGTVSGDSWTADTEFVLDDRLVKAQVTWTEQSPTAQSYKMVGSIDGSPSWLLEQATGTKIQ